MPAVVIQVVVVARVERSSRARRPAKQCLRPQARIERVVVENRARERRLRELIGDASSQNIDFECDSISVVAFQTLVIEIE